MIFQCKELEWWHPGGKSPTLRGIDFSINEGEVVAFLGISGSGKTTLLQVLGLLWEKQPEKGYIFYRPEGSSKEYDVVIDYRTMSKDTRALLRSKHFGFVLQNSSVIPHFTVLQNIAIPLLANGICERDAHEQAQSLLEMESRKQGRGFDSGRTLLDKRFEPAGKISQGQRQRLAILRAIVGNPKVIFADEPTSNLDMDNSRNVFRLLHLWRTGEIGASTSESRTLLVITHDTRQAFHPDYLNASRFVCMAGGNTDQPGGKIIQDIKREDIGGFGDLAAMLGPNYVFEMNG